MNTTTSDIETKLKTERVEFFDKLVSAVRKAGLTIAREVRNDAMLFAEVKSDKAEKWMIHLHVERHGWRGNGNRLKVGLYRNQEIFRKLDDNRIKAVVDDLLLRVQNAVYHEVNAAKATLERKSWATVMEQQMAGVAHIPGITLKIENGGSTAGDYYFEFESEHPFKHMNADQVKAFYAFVEANFKLHPYRVGTKVHVKGYFANPNMEFSGTVTEAHTSRIMVLVPGDESARAVYLNQTSSVITILS